MRFESWLYRALSLPATLAIIAFAGSASVRAETTFKRIPLQYIAALASPTATSGTGAEAWGVWRLDPGPRGVRLSNYEALKANGGVAPAAWKFDGSDWWLEENGLIMEAPEFGIAPGKYVVTGNREKVSILTVHAKDADGKQRWELSDGATVFDVTHLKCRSARYKPAEGNAMCSPEQAPGREFPVTPGADMPPVPGCHKQDYAVLFLIGVGVGD